MGNTLTGQIVAETYEALLKVTDNGIITGTKKRITDGFGNDTPLLLSSTDVQIDGNLLLAGTISQYVRGDGSFATFTDVGLTSVGLTIGSAGTDVAVSGSPLTANGSITLNLPSASATNRGLLTAADWSIFNSKQGSLTLTTTGSSGASTLIGSTLNVPNYTLAGLGGVPYTGATGNVDLGTHTLSAYNLIVNHTSGSGNAVSITKGGSGEALTITKTSGSGNAASISGGVTLISELHLTTDLADAYIASASTWNAKENALTFSSPLSRSTNTISIPAATTSVNGYLTSTDWTTFNNKVGGSGTTNYISKFTSSSAIGNSQIFDNGTSVGIGTASPSSKLEVYVNDNSLTGAKVTNVSGGVGAAAITNYSNGISSHYFGTLGTSYAGYGVLLANEGFIYTAGQSLSLAADGANSIKFGTGTGTPERMRITSAGNVGIGTTSPSRLLSVNGQAFISADIFQGSNSGIFFSGDGSYASGIYGRNSGLDLALQTNSNERMRITSTGNVGIGTNSPAYQLQLSTDSAAKPTSALWTIASDLRIKENITPYSKGLKELMLINPINYDYNGLGGFKKGKGGVGIIAQEILNILPDSVSSVKGKLNEGDKEETDILNFNGHELTYVLINAIKELKAELDELKNNK